jgi:hypothetical protein
MPGLLGGGSAFRDLARLPQLEAIALRVNGVPEAAVAGLGHLVVDAGAGRSQILFYGTSPHSIALLCCSLFSLVPGCRSWL